ncbi:MAG: RdgB/HAM1 family non-canonical purine NTP pyrophosphatase [Flavitalea sp.]
MTKILFATNNQNKILEIQTAIGNTLQVVGLKESGIFITIPEPYETLQENASEKSSTIFALTGMSCFSEDSGLEVYALNALPGVHSARYAGDHCSDRDNIDKLLLSLTGIHERMARFRTIISLIWGGKEYFFEGTCRGYISKEKRGTNGFGYDPVFVPAGSELTFGQMTLEEKNRFSHRKKAAEGLVRFLQEQTHITTFD